MRKIKKYKFFQRLSILILIAVFVLAPLRFDLATMGKAKADWTDWVDNGQEFIIEDTVWEKGEHFLDRSVVIENGATLTIKKGAKIIFQESVSGETPYLAVGDGKIIADGTSDEKIVFTSEEGSDLGFLIWFADYSLSDKVSFFRYVEINNGGKKYEEGGIFSNANSGIWNSALAWSDEGMPAIMYSSGKAHIENSTFIDNNFADIEADGYFNQENVNNFLEVVNSNFGNNENGIAVVSNIECDLDSCKDKIRLKNNWYGDENGPSGEISNSETQGASVSGELLMDGWRKNSLIADPVVIVPGITGSNQFLGEWKLDPITHTYDDLVDSLKTNGYIEGQNLFYFPYDWRKNNATTAHYLQSKIESVIVETKTSKVDVIAHSMGGLVARAYIEEIEGCDYENTIDQLITLGTPQKGSPEAYLKWEAGEGFFSMNENLAKHHFKQEAEEEGYDDLQKYIREKVVSVGELLPEYDYLFDISDDKIRNYPNNYPANDFLEELNRIGNVEKLEKINHINIIGKLENTSSTISKIRVVDSAVSGKWENGMPENFYDDSTSRGLEFGEGDETVPLESAKGIIADKNIELNSIHSELPTKAQCEIFRELTGKQECDYDEDIHFVNILLFNVFSPVDLQITAPDGKRIGKDFATGEILN
ncbi:MAG TPA: hypothetical protein DEA27_04065, partial [Candidatus Moranbacteria bacterium]|nr:hypothetical protein [Candidatus Moranbacteria bacterium]